MEKNNVLTTGISTLCVNLSSRLLEVVELSDNLALLFYEYKRSIYVQWLQVDTDNKIVVLKDTPLDPNLITYDSNFIVKQLSSNTLVVSYIHKNTAIVRMIGVHIKNQELIIHKEYVNSNITYCAYEIVVIDDNMIALIYSKYNRSHESSNIGNSILYIDYLCKNYDAIESIGIYKITTGAFFIDQYSVAVLSHDKLLVAYTTDGRYGQPMGKVHFQIVTLNINDYDVIVSNTVGFRGMEHEYIQLVGIDSTHALLFYAQGDPSVCNKVRMIEIIDTEINIKDINTYSPIYGYIPSILKWSDNKVLISDIDLRTDTIQLVNSLTISGDKIFPDGSPIICGVPITHGVTNGSKLIRLSENKALLIYNVNSPDSWCAEDAGPIHAQVITVYDKVDSKSPSITKRQEILRNLNPKEFRVYHELCNRPLTREDAEILLDCKKMTALNTLTSLIEKGIAIQQGDGRETYYTFVPA